MTVVGVNADVNVTIVAKVMAVATVSGMIATVAIVIEIQNKSEVK